MLNLQNQSHFGFSFKPLCLLNTTRCRYEFSLWGGGAGEDGWGMEGRSFFFLIHYSFQLLDQIVVLVFLEYVSLFCFLVIILYFLSILLIMKKILKALHFCIGMHGLFQHTFFTIILLIYISFWLCWVFVAVWVFLSVTESSGYSLAAVYRLLVAVALSLPSMGSRAQGIGSSAKLICACGIFPDQGSKPCLLHWQVDP